MNCSELCFLEVMDFISHNINMIFTYLILPYKEWLDPPKSAGLMQLPVLPPGNMCCLLHLPIDVSEAPNLHNHMALILII